MRLALCLSLCAASTPASAATFTIGLYVVNDHARAEQRGGETEANTAAIVADAASILQSAGLTSDVRIAFVGQRTYRALDPWPAPGSQAGIDVLTAFNGWVQSQADLDSKDLVFLFGSTGAEQSSTHAAFVNGLCGSNSTGFLRTTSDDGALLAALLAHAIGHSLGMKHDGQGNACATSGNLMAAAFDPDGLSTLVMTRRVISIVTSG